MAENLSQQLKNYDLDELKSLSQKIRQEIIDSVSINGGHLSPNLGVVELTIALHKIFDFPTDSLIFDVGHQSYTHKILSGREEEFKKIRQFDSISGFPRPEESEYDSFIAGHAGAALSAAIGISESKFLTNDQSSTIAVIGDGSIGCGMTLEALTRAYYRNLVTVLLCCGGSFGAVSIVPVCDKALESADTNGLALDTSDTL